MRSNHSFSIDFVIRKCKEDKKKAFIYARITVDGEAPTEVSIKEKINISDWNNQKEIVRGNSVEVKAINKTIDDARFQIKMHYRLMREQELLVTSQKLKEAYLGKNNFKKEKDLVELTDYYKKIREQKI